MRAKNKGVDDQGPDEPQVRKTMSEQIKAGIIGGDQEGHFVHCSIGRWLIPWAGCADFPALQIRLAVGSVSILVDRQLTGVRITAYLVKYTGGSSPPCVCVKPKRGRQAERRQTVP